MTNIYNVSFYLRLDRKQSNSAPIYVSISLNNKRLRFSTNHSINSNSWDTIKGLPKGNSLEIKQLIMKLEEIKSCLFNAYHELVLLKKPFTIEDVKNKFSGFTVEQQTLMGLFDYHFNVAQNTLAQSTIVHYNVTQRHFRNFIKKCYRKSDVFLTDLNSKFIVDFEQFMYNRNNEEQLRKPCKNNGIMKHIVRLKKVVNLAIRNEWLEKDPFTKYKLSYQHINREFLTEAELLRIENKEFSLPRIQLVKDLFIFSCYTGLAYVDALGLTTDNICYGIDGNMWIKTNRAKTTTVVSLPVLPKAAEIIEKYKNLPYVINSNRVLPTLSNQKVNSYLKEIADLCEINKPLTHHIARHTFATTVTLTNGVPIETVSKMLGHKNIKTTQIYAKVIDTKTSYDMELLKQKLSQKSSKVSLAV